MLQIGSGKLFQREAEYRNNLKGVIYTNLRLIGDEKLETMAGSVVATTNLYDSNVLIYEIEELVEAYGDGPGVLISHGIDSFILDFSSILSFALNCTASPSYALTERLLGDQLGVTTHTTPKQILKRVFDKNVDCQVEDVKFFTDFTDHLIGLERKTYLGVMSSIRTYVTGMQRIADDFELAYTLFVASIESLAQNFDGHQSTWSDYDHKKRKAIDNALNDADDTITDKVREAILLYEHTSLGKRFKEFSIQHLDSRYYREEAKDTINPISSFDLPMALTNAYLARSKYIHNLQKLPKSLNMSNTYTETCRIEGKTWLTLQGLSRLARHVIIKFIMEKNTVEKEIYNYELERSNIMTLQLSPEFWVAKIDFRNGIGNRKLEGFLCQLAGCIEHTPNARITALTELLEEVEEKITSLKEEDRRAFVALYILYYACTKTDKKEKHRKFIENHEKEILTPCNAGLIVNLLLRLNLYPDLQVSHDYLIKYFKERDHKLTIRFPKIFETGIILQLAERYRRNNDKKKAIELIEMAVENYPGNPLLRQFEEDYKSEPQVIDWEKVLLPAKISDDML